MKSIFGSAVRYLTVVIALFGTVSRIILAAADGRPLDIFGYFTIQSNLMVCVFLIVALVRGDKPLPQSKARMHTAHGAVLLYILVTAIIYNTLLAGALSEPPFSSLLLVINHTVTPALFLLDWILHQERARYRPRTVWIWLIYPVAYAIFGSIEGWLTGRFRYFFLDFASVSLGQYVIQMGSVVVFFVLLSLLIVAVNRVLNRAQIVE
jgi:hypothetical protein